MKTININGKKIKHFKFQLPISAKHLSKIKHILKTEKDFIIEYINPIN